MAFRFSAELIWTIIISFTECNKRVNISHRLGCRTRLVVMETGTKGQKWVPQAPRGARYGNKHKLGA